MLKEKIHKFIFNHPGLLHSAKLFLSNKHIANSVVYKRMVMKKARRFAEKSKEYEEAISIETALSCNSRCVFCGHHNKTMTGTMTRELYEKIIDQCHEYGIKTIFFGVYGEFLTDRFMFERIGYLKKYGMKYGFITNASLMTPEITDKLLEAGSLTCINFSVNGFSREVYEKTMVGLKRDVAYKNILYFLKQKEKLQADELAVVITAVRTKLNRKDLKNFYNFWRKKKGISSILPIELMDRMGKDYEGELGELGAMDNKSNWLSPCKYVWEAARVYYDGRVSTCCKEDDERKFIIGDLNRQTLREVLDGETLKNLRQCHIAGKRKSHPVCGKCYLNSIWLG
jgi:MoaA/NifB/PqqE/SkfB family radical SAM enzyme